MKEFQSFRTELNEGIEDLQEHIAITSSSLPPNILILRRKTVRQFPNNTMVALYYNDKLGQYFSIPYGGDAGGVVTPVALKEDARGFEGVIGEDGVRRTFLPGREHAYGSSRHDSKWMAEFEKHVVKAAPEHTGKIDWNTAHYLHSAGHKPEAAATLYHTRRRDKLEEGVIDRLRHIKDFHAVNHIQHADGTRTTVDPTTAHALLMVHDALKPEHQEKFASHLEHSKPKFHKMLDFTWKQVK